MVGATMSQVSISECSYSDLHVPVVDFAQEA